MLSADDEGARHLEGGEGMAEPRPNGGYSRSNWPKYLVIYLLVGAAVYALVWFLFLRDGALYG
jgi:hypothetical protein